LTGVPETLVRHAQALHRQGRVPEAIEAYRQILARWPGQAECWFNLGVLQRGQHQFHQALASYQQALDHGIPAPEEVHVNRGVIYSDYLRQDAAAEQELRQALTLNPTYIPALLNLANLSEDLGRHAEAGTLYRRILTLEPEHREALARYANLQPATQPQETLIAQLQSALRSTAAAAERASLGFALGRLLDGKADYRGAFAAYTAANEANRSSAPPGMAAYDRKAREELIQRLIRDSPRVAATVGTGARASAPRPIFICGLFRSGSTLAEQVLGGHPEVTAGGELNILPRLASGLGLFPPSSSGWPAPERVAAAATQYLDELRQMFPGAGYVTDKRLDNFLHIGLIKSLFPDSRIVHTTRNPLDNCLSIFFLHLDPAVSYAHDLMDIAHYYRQYRILMEHWQRCFGSDVFEFNYDSFVRQPAAQAQRLFEFLGLQWDERYLSPESRSGAVKTASVWQVREPLYTRSSGRAANYADQLGALREYLM
jgi:tetratricopeptide (TPR) repeat protein